MIKPTNNGFFCSLLTAASLVTASSAWAIDFTPDTGQIARPGTGFQDPVRELPSNADLNICIATGSMKHFKTSNGVDANNNSQELENAGLETGAIYLRIMWQDIEPQDDNWQFDRIEKMLQCANKKGQAVDLRIMLTDPFGLGPAGLPTWLDDGRTESNSLHYSYKASVGSDAEYNVPDFSNPVLKKEHNELIAELGKRFDGHKDLNSIDIGSIGWWGEWHYKATTATSGLHNAFMPLEPIQQEIIQHYINSFPTTPKVALEGAHFDTGSDPYTSTTAGFLRAKPDIGWRADSWGPVYFNGRYDDLLYSPVGLENTWKTGMVSLEINDNSFNDWPVRVALPDGNSERIDPIWVSVQKAKNWHVSTINSKIGGFPTNYLSGNNGLQVLSAVMGYNLVLENATVGSSASAGETLSIPMTWKNQGLAPLYRNFVISFRLKDSLGNIVHEVKTDISLKGFTPDEGSLGVSPQFVIPGSLAAGTYKLETALVFNGSTNNGNGVSNVISYQNDYSSIAPISVTARNLDDNWVPLVNEFTIGSNTQEIFPSRIVAGYSDTNNQSNGSFDPKSWRLNDGTVGSEDGTAKYDEWYSWSNGGQSNQAYVHFDFDAPVQISSIQYFDEHNRKISVVVKDSNDNPVPGGGAYAVSTTGRQGTTVPLPATVVGSRVTIFTDATFGYGSAPDSLWFTPTEINVFGTP